MKDKHTPGPIRPIIHEAIGGGDYIQLLVGSWDIAHNRHSARDWEEEKANAKLLTAGFNSYDKHCGDHAVECAEGDLLGEALEACEVALSLNEGTHTHVMTEYVNNQLRAVIAKAKGETS